MHFICLEYLCPINIHLHLTHNYEMHFEKAAKEEAKDSTGYSDCYRLHDLAHGHSSQVISLLEISYKLNIYVR